MKQFSNLGISNDQYPIRFRSRPGQTSLIHRNVSTLPQLLILPIYWTVRAYTVASGSGAISALLQAGFPILEVNVCVLFTKVPPPSLAA
jgi:hypothetical protein